jgi:putative spermidine/putrescine transport system ATP-binding protein
MSDRIAVLDKGRIQQVDPPQVLYDHPKTHFVADFIGESFSLPVTICDGGATLFGQPLHLPGKITGSAPHFLVLRPEKLMLLPEHPTEAEAGINAIKGQVRQSVFHGDSVMIYVAVHGEHEIALRVPLRGKVALPQPGDHVRLGYGVEDTIVVPAAIAAEETR